MVECSSVTALAAIGAAFIGFKLLTLLKTLFDAYVASGVSVSSNVNRGSLHTYSFTFFFFYSSRSSVLVKVLGQVK